MMMGFEVVHRWLSCGSRCVHSWPLSQCGISQGCRHCRTRYGRSFRFACQQWEMKCGFHPRFDCACRGGEALCSLPQLRELDLWSCHHIEPWPCPRSFAHPFLRLYVGVIQHAANRTGWSDKGPARAAQQSNDILKCKSFDGTDLLSRQVGTQQCGCEVSAGGDAHTVSAITESLSREFGTLMVSQDCKCILIQISDMHPNRLPSGRSS